MNTQVEDSVRYAFVAEWFDPQAALMRQYQLFLYPRDGSIEIFDLKTRRTFLKKTKYETVKPSDFYLGNTINVFSRQMALKEFGDEFTRKALQSTQESTLAIIKPDAIRFKGDILQAMYRDGFRVVQAQTVHLTKQQVAQFYAEHQGKPFFNNLGDLMTSGCSLAMELMRPNAVNRWRDLLGPTSSEAARTQAPNSIRGRFGTDNTRNACHGSDSPESARIELEFFFPKSSNKAPRNTARLNDTTLAVIKPHAFKEGKFADIIKDIEQNGFQITALKTFNLEKNDAEEFLEVYKSVVAEYGDMVTEMCSGTCVALEVAADSDPAKFRSFVGPADPEIARHLRPHTLRAKYGSTKVRNGLHVTDLVDDAPLEVEYFFRILSQ
jgi:nucleoside-diphosphate kinase